MMLSTTKLNGQPSIRRCVRAMAGLVLLLPLVADSSVLQVAAAEEPIRTRGADIVVQEINRLIRETWKDNEVEPSPVADDAEWIRRVYLDIVGHIPAVEDVEKFLADKDKAKRAQLIDRLLDDPGYTRNWTTIWTNLCIGQQTPRRVSRTGMQKFFREAFGKNRPWNEIVSDLVTAEGHYEENGAANFLLAQMQDQDDGIQMTAKTTRLFMGMQVQCTQCHDHPFNDWKQDQFWQFNSFFRQTAKVDHRRFDQKTGQMVDDFSEIVERDFSGPVYFEKRSGLMKVAYPSYFGVDINPDSTTDRRRELAKLMTVGDRPMIALAYINRLWAHFFGYGFTNPIDDIGSHIPVTHPELFDRLADEFVKSGYNCKQAIRWIANSEAYNLTSRTTKKNAQDNPAIGEAALFTHVYVKPMTAEQLYDSLIVATNAHKSGRSGWEQAEVQRHAWLQSFVQTFGTDEGDEATSFDGTIPQALMMMNGPLVQDAVSVKPGSYLHQLLTGKGTDNHKIQRLYLSALSRMPNKAEIAAAQRFLNSNQDPLTVYQDLFWALLNSNEFIINH
ncbi:DUF1549 and DUF1553 domain-containing protein [Schlesneria sp. DSM 10557]|uniref:DUF1549 and DUF1553 domain-containing protein n=1 Tax=Schlesneria sp. DSM 10557 TaxID=3044399 RepID=UPI00359FDE95